MADEADKVVREACRAAGNDPGRLMDILIAVQGRLGCLSSESIREIAGQVGCSRVEVESAATFYSFFSPKPKGKIVIRLCHDIIDRMQGSDRVAKAFSEELGIAFGETTPDGLISLEYTPCIGMCDQAPAALINEEVATYLSGDKAREIVRTLRKSGDPKKIVSRLGDGNNAHDLVRSMVHNGLRKKGPVIFAPYEAEAGLRRALAMSPAEVIREVKTARIRGRGGAGFPTGMKWEFTRGAEGVRKFVIGNADEGEPGTFKDRVILTEKYDLVFEGMAIAGYAVGAENGILYLRGEYAYLKAFLQQKIEERRKKNLLGNGILGKKDFHFDIRIQMGAGAYVCGEETALISSCEGWRGDPKTRPPFPAQKGYLGCPTTVNNVETFCCVARVMEKGATWFAEIGSKGSPSTKLLSVSGECSGPGVYEFAFGTTVKDLLKEVGAEEAQAVLVGGPSGQFIGPAEFHRTICYDDLGTGGAVVIFGPERNLLEAVRDYMEFFVDESCGYCTPCRVGNVLMKRKIDEILEGKGEPGDLEYLRELGESVKLTSRCGLGQTSPNPVLSTLRNFRAVYEAAVTKNDSGRQKTFDVQEALRDAEMIAGRKSSIFQP